MNEYTNTQIASSRNAELTAKARKAGLTSRNATPQHPPQLVRPDRQAADARRRQVTSAGRRSNTHHRFISAPKS